MMLDEDAIEQNLIDLLQQQGYILFNDSASRKFMKYVPWWA